MSGGKKKVAVNVEVDDKPTREDNYGSVEGATDSEVSKEKPITERGSGKVRRAEARTYQCTCPSQATADFPVPVSVGENEMEKLCDPVVEWYEVEADELAAVRMVL